MSKSLINKLASFSIGSFISLIIGLISTPIITRLISPEEYGRGSMFIMVTSLISILIMMGCEQAFVRFFYAEDEISRGALLRKCIIIPLIIWCILISIFNILVYLLHLNIGVSGYVNIILIQSGILAMNTFAMLVIRMQQKGKIYSFSTVLLKILYFIFIVLFANLFNGSYISLIIATILSTSIVLLFNMLSQKSYWMLNNKEKKSKNSIKNIITFGMPLVFTYIINWLFQSTDKIFLEMFYGYYEVGIYSQGATLVGTIAIIQVAFTNFWTPVAYEQYVKNNENTIFFKEMFELVSLVMISLGILVNMFKDLFLILLGREYSEAIYIVPFLMFMPIMYSISEVSQVGINFKKKQKSHLIIAIVSCLTNIILAAIMIPYIGSKGAAISTGVAYIVFFILRTYFSEKYYKIGFNYKKISIMISILFLYSMIGTIYKSNYIYVLIGIASMISIVGMNKNIIIKNINYMKSKRG